MVTIKVTDYLTLQGETTVILIPGAYKLAGLDKMMNKCL
jgi:hypothetical protein